MPDRILRDWTDSEPLSSITANSERFFVRLLMKMDDYGCYHADARLLRANLFPLLIDRIREADIARWIAECEKAGIVRSYESGGKRFIFVPKHGQRLRDSRRKFPEPPAIEGDPPQSAATCGDSLPYSESNSNAESETSRARGFSFENPDADNPIQRLQGWELGGLGPVTSKPELRLAMAEWLLEVRSRKPPKDPTPRQWRAQIARLEEMGFQRALAAIRYSLAQGYTGICEENAIKNGNGKHKARSAATVREDR